MGSVPIQSQVRALASTRIVEAGVNERRISQDIRKALGLEPGLVLWRNTTGHTVEFDNDGNLRHINYGLCVGSADFIGCLDGRFIALEIKRPGGRRRPEQLQFCNQVRFNGGLAAIVESVDEAKAAIARARTGARE